MTPVGSQPSGLHTVHVQSQVHNLQLELMRAQKE